MFFIDSYLVYELFTPTERRPKKQKFSENNFGSDRYIQEIWMDSATEKQNFQNFRNNKRFTEKYSLYHQEDSQT